ncbi:hypothetical protein ABZX12_41200 [Kribbella sp. NPDC003505]|uniref:hypothetical protein n=1 Tax=Kribbella sp. NPDC003505 TaxID=3154448 RepID=UPI0033A2637D
MSNKTPSVQKGQARGNRRSTPPVAPMQTARVPVPSKIVSESDDGRWGKWRVAVLVAVITGFLGLIGVGITALVTLRSSFEQADAARDSSREQADAALSGTRSQIDENRASAIRDRQSKVYAAYLNAAVAYRDRTYSTGQTVKANKGKPYSTNFVALAQYNEARRAFQDQANQVAIYGSTQAWDAHLLVAKAMPAPLKKGNVTGPDYEAFGVGYRKFVIVACVDVSGKTQQQCETAQAVGATR